MFVAEQEAPRRGPQRPGGSAASASGDAGAEAPTDGHPLAEVPLERIEAELCELSAQIYASTCRWLHLVAEFDRRAGWGDWVGVRSCAEWLAWRCAISPRSAREHVRVARRLCELPRIDAAFAQGRLSYSKVRALTRIATPDSEAELLELANHATAAQLERMIRAARRVTAQEAAEAHERAHCLWTWEEDGSLYLTARLPADEGAALLAALEAARDELRERRRAQGRAEGEDPAGADRWLDADQAANPALRGSAEPQPAESPPTYRRPTNDECLAHLAETALARGPTRASPASRQQVIVHVDAARLAAGERSQRGAEDGACHLDSGPAISAATARRIGCDASLVGVAHGPDGEVLSVGRRTRSVPAALRRALELRDRGCRFPGCEQRRFTDAHHIRHWADGGETSLENLILLCRRHHRVCHEHGYAIELADRGRPVFRSPLGHVVPAAPALGPASADALADRPNGAAVGPVLTGTGERIDLGYCVDAVLAAVGFAD